MIPRMTSERREPGLLSWQWRGYPEFHRDRGNLIVHVLTQPIFAAGFVALVTAPLAGALWPAFARAGAGLAAMVVAIAAQGRGHAREASPPVPFSGPLDVFGRILGEQLITFPRFVITGGLARAWRESRRTAA